MAENRQSIGLEQNLRLTLTPQQLRFVKLLEMNTPELEEAVNRELEENVALTQEDSDLPLSSISSTSSSEYQHDPYSTSKYYRGSQNTDEDSPSFAPADTEESIYDTLLSRLSEKRLPAAVEAGAKYIIGNLDSNGYLDRPLESMMNDLAFNEGIDLTPEEGRKALKAVRSLEPAGIGAFNLRDTLEMQLSRLPDSPTVENARRILSEAYEAFTMKHKHRIISRLKISEKEADKALDLIRSLNPRPGAALGYSRTDEASVIIPDYIVNVENGEITVGLNSHIPELKIDESFSQAVADMEHSAKGRQRKGSEFIMRNYNDAREFIAVLSQRQKTMMDVITAIVSWQKDYFLTQDVYNLRPMMIKNVAELTGLDFSVISRATNSKYVSTPWGIFPMRFFFSDSVGENAEGTEALTNRKIEEGIRALVDEEDKHHPLSDREIMEEMAKSGYELSRRTVAKYRDRLGIPVALSLIHI